MKKLLALMLLMLSIAPIAMAEPAEAPVRAALEAQLKERSEAETDPWAMYLLGQPLEDVMLGEGRVAFSVCAWATDAEGLSGDIDGWLQAINDQVSASRVQGEVRYEVQENGVTLTGGVDAFVSDVRAAAKSARAAFDLAKVRRALAQQLLPGAPYDTEAFESLAARYAGQFSRGELKVALSTVKRVTLGVDGGPSALRLVFYAVPGDTVAERSLPRAIDRLREIDKANGMDDAQLLDVYAEAAMEVADEMNKTSQHALVVDYARVLQGDLQNDDFVAFVGEATAAMRANLDLLREEAASLPDHPRREQPATGVLSGPDAGTKLLLRASDDGHGRLVWLEDESGHVALSAFARSGASLLCAAPEGEYTVHVAKGIDWFGEVQMFGDQGQYSASPETLAIADATHYHTISLGAEGGNTAMVQVPFEPNE